MKIIDERGEVIFEGPVGKTHNFVRDVVFANLDGQLSDLSARIADLEERLALQERHAMKLMHERDTAVNRGVLTAKAYGRWWEKK